MSEEKRRKREKGQLKKFRRKNTHHLNQPFYWTTTCFVLPENYEEQFMIAINPARIEIYQEKNRPLFLPPYRLI